MSIKILMPALSPTMKDGNLSKWLIKKGDKVNSGDVIAEIETDKATMEIESVDEGIIKEILFKEGTEGIKVNNIKDIKDAINTGINNQLNGKTTVIEMMVSRELDTPFRKDAMNLPKRLLDKYKGLSVDIERLYGQPVDMSR